MNSPRAPAGWSRPGSDSSWFAATGAGFALLVWLLAISGTDAEALLVVIELQSGPVALSASRAHGVKSPDALGGAQVIDAVVTFG